jgi:hypothetical protein
MCRYVYPLTVARQRLSKNLTAATNTHATIEEFFWRTVLYAVLLYQRKVDNCFFTELTVFFENIFTGTQMKKIKERERAET